MINKRFNSYLFVPDIKARSIDVDPIPEPTQSATYQSQFRPGIPTHWKAHQWQTMEKKSENLSAN